LAYYLGRTRVAVDATGCSIPPALGPPQRLAADLRGCRGLRRCKTVVSRGRRDSKDRPVPVPSGVDRRRHLVRRSHRSACNCRIRRLHSGVRVAAVSAAHRPARRRVAGSSRHRRRLATGQTLRCVPAGHAARADLPTYIGPADGITWRNPTSPWWSAGDQVVEVAIVVFRQEPALTG